MTAPLFHLGAGELETARTGTLVELTGPEGHHAATVMRLQVGEQVQLSDTETTLVHGVVSAVGQGRLTVEVHQVINAPLPRPRLVLVQALSKDKRDVQAVESATELGVDAVQPWQAERSVVRWKAGREAKKHAEWVSTVTAAAKQTRRISLPSVRPLVNTTQYVAGLQQNTAVIVLHETQQQSLRNAVEQIGEVAELHLVVGPEGGITDQEIHQLTTAGAQVARLGANVLRSSTAGPAAISGTQLLLGRWDW